MEVNSYMCCPNAQGVVCSVKDTNTLECLLPNFSTVDSDLKSNISYTVRYGGAPGPDLTLTELVLHQRPNPYFPEDGSALSPTEFSPGTTGLLRITVSLTITDHVMVNHGPQYNEFCYDWQNFIYVLYCIGN